MPKKPAQEEKTLKEKTEKPKVTKEPEEQPRTKTLPTFLVGKKPVIDERPANKLVTAEEKQDAESEVAANKEPQQSKIPETIEPVEETPEADPISSFQFNAQSEETDADTKPVLEQTTTLKEDDSEPSSFASLMQSRRASSIQVKVEKDKESAEGGSGKKGFYIIVGVLFVLILIAFGYLIYTRNKANQQQTSTDSTATPTVSPTVATEEPLYDKIAKLIELPKGEEYVEGQITDIDELRTIDSLLFANAENGNVLLIFPDSKRIYIYDARNARLVDSSITEKVVEIAASPGITTGTDTDATPNPETGETGESLTIEIRNGTAISGATLSFQKLIEAEGSEFKVEKRANAQLNTYAKSVLIDLTDGSKQSLIDKLTDKFGFEVVKNLPEGELATKSEILIIMGADNT